MTVATKTIPKGYKQTEIGVIPTDWDVQPIGHIAKITTGSKNTQDKVDTGLYPFFVRSQVIERINSYSYDGEAILTAGDGVGTGKVFHYINGKFDIHQRVYKISDFSNDINGYYFYLYFSNNFYNRIMQMTAKSSVDSVRMEMIADMQIPLPGKPEQISIATALSDIDALIEKTESLIEKKKAIKQGAMQELLTGKKRLPGFDGEWEEKELGSIGKCLRGVSYNGERDLHAYDTSSTARLLRSNNIQSNIVELNNLQFVDIQRVSDIQILKENDIVICMANGSKNLVGKSAIFKQKDIYKYTFGAFMGCFRINHNLVDSNFILFNFQTFRYRSYIDVLLSGSSINNLKPSDIESIKIKIPIQKQEQTAIATILSDMDSEIEKLESELTKWRDMKQGMMQTLLTGKIRLIK